MDISELLDTLSSPAKAYEKVYLAHGLNDVAITCVYKSESSGTRERTEEIRSIECSGEPAVLLNNSIGRSFRLDRISSDIECEGKSYSKDTFLTDYLNLSIEEINVALQLAAFYQDVRQNMDKYMGYFLAGRAPVWSGSLMTRFKYQRNSGGLVFDLKNVFQLDNEEFFLWGFSNELFRFMFVPYEQIKGKIETEEAAKTKKTFLRDLLDVKK